MATSTKSIVEGSFLISIAILLYLLGIYNAAIGIITTLFCPIPIVLLVIRHDTKIIFCVFIASILLLTSLAGIYDALTFILQFFITGYIMGYYIKKNSSPEKIIAITSIAYFFSTLIFTFILSYLLKKDLIGQLFKDFESSINYVLRFQKEKLAGDFENLDIDALKNQLIQIFKRVYPAFFMFAALLGVIINYEIARQIINKLGYSIKQMTIVNLKLPDNWIWGFILSFAFSFVKIENLIGVSNLATILNNIALNILILYLFIYFFQGIFICILYMKKWQFSRFFLITNLILIFLMPSIWFIPLLLGIFDFWFNFRTRIMKNDETIKKNPPSTEI